MLPAMSYIEVMGREMDGWYKVNTYDANGGVYPGVISGQDLDVVWVMAPQQSTQPFANSTESLEVPERQNISQPRTFAGEALSPPQPQQQITGVVYITESGKKFHLPSCNHLKSHIAINRREAIAGGYSACSVCNP